MCAEGAVQLRGKSNLDSAKSWNETLGQHVSCPNPTLSDVTFAPAESVVAQNGNRITIGSDVILRAGGLLDIGRVFSVVVSLDREHSFLVYHPFVWLDELDQQFKMPAVVCQTIYRAIPCLVCHLFVDRWPVFVT